jgi:FKBP-type peptidyl-prolyl cis-trans isomerase (trigger factor)
MTNFNLNEMTLEELRNLETEIKTAKVARKEIEKQLVLDTKESRVLEFKGHVKPNDIVTFDYNGGIATGTIVRVSEGSITVKSDDFIGKKDTNYVKYHKIVTVTTPEVEIVA